MEKVNRGKRLRMMSEEVYMERLQKQLLKFVPTTDKDSCWLWQGSKNKGGYGTTRVYGKTTNSHRASYYAFKGDIPQGMCVCHTCDTPSCINPNHLFLGTMADNMADVITKGRRPTGGQDKRSIAVMIDGIVYGSLREAERRLNICRGSIPNMVRKQRATIVAKEFNCGKSQ